MFKKKCKDGSEKNKYEHETYVNTSDAGKRC